MIERNGRQRVRLLALAAAVVVGWAAERTAFAIGDVCSNVNIKLTNATGDEIKVTKFEYYDFKEKKWRTEVMFGVDGHQKLEPGKSWTKKQDLEHVENDNTKFKVTYQSHIGGSKWDESTAKETSDFTCKDGMTKEVVIDVGQSPAALKVEKCTSVQAAEIGETIDWGAKNWTKYEKVLEKIRGWPVNIGKCLEGRFKSDGRVICEQSQGGSCSDRSGDNNGFASPLNKRCHMCPSFLDSVAKIAGKENRQACYLALVTHEWGHTCERGHKTLEIIDNEAFNFWKSQHSTTVTIKLRDCLMD
jgi:hypothetical protein